MRKAKYNSKGNQVVETGFKKFDKQTNNISYGNVISNTQYSSYIRPYNEIKNGAYIGKPGEFLKYDMQHFKRVPDNIKKVLEDPNRTESYCLYEFFTYEKGNKEIFAYLLQDHNRKLIDSYVVCYGNQNWNKRYAALNYIISLICVDGTIKIPEVVKEHFENMDSLTYVDYYQYKGKEYRLQAYSRIDSLSDDVCIKHPIVSVYEVTDTIMEWGKPKTELIDIVDVNWNYPQFKKDYHKYN